jgi:hypothetical protein
MTGTPLAQRLAHVAPLPGRHHHLGDPVRVPGIDGARDGDTDADEPVRAELPLREAGLGELGHQRHRPVRIVPHRVVAMLPGQHLSPQVGERGRDVASAHVDAEEAVCVVLELQDDGSPAALRGAVAHLGDQAGLQELGDDLGDRGAAEPRRARDVGAGEPSLLPEKLQHAGDARAPGPLGWFRPGCRRTAHGAWLLAFH